MRILIMDDRHVFASALHARLEQDPRFEIVGVAGDRDEVVQLAAEVEPHVVLLDAALSNGVRSMPRGGSCAESGPHAC